MWLLVEWREHGLSEMLEAGAEPRGSVYGREFEHDCHISETLPPVIRSSGVLAYQLGGLLYHEEPDQVRCLVNDFRSIVAQMDQLSQYSQRPALQAATARRQSAIWRL